MRRTIGKLRVLWLWAWPLRPKLGALPRSWRRAGMLVAVPSACLLVACVAFNCRSDEALTLDSGSPPAGEPVIRVLLTSGPVGEASVGTTAGYWLKADGAVVAESSEPLRAVVRRDVGGWRVGSWAAPGRELVIQPVGGAFVRLGDVTYRGDLRLLSADGGRFLAVNRADLEDYLAGVLSKELYPNWAPETYRALAVAARTFALYHMTTSGATSEYDLGDNQASQVYGGVPGETARSREAVRVTRGVVLSCGRPGEERIFLAQYSACCGGRVNGAYVIRNAHRVEPLEGGQVCIDCAACSRYRWPPVRIAKSDIHRALAARYAAARDLGGLSDVQVVTATPYGRAVWVDAVGPTGRKVRLRAEDVRLALISAGVPAAKGLNSMNCDIVDVGAALEFRNGRGFGHGVGLCQWGAQAKAQQGWTAEQILGFYYPGARLYRAY